jgi:hypothetical protein
MADTQTGTSGVSVLAAGTTAAAELGPAGATLTEPTNGNCNGCHEWFCDWWIFFLTAVANNPNVLDQAFDDIKADFVKRYQKLPGPTS